MRRVVEVFVASPGDVQAEREALAREIERLNRSVAHPLGLSLEPWRWEKDAVPGLGEPQELINPRVDEADIVVVILWNRLGTPTGRAASGTVEEYERAFARWEASGRPQVMVYACQRPANLTTPEALEQKIGVVSFLKSIDKVALTSRYTALAEFAEERTPATRPAAFGTLARAFLDQREYRIRGVEDAASALVPSLVALIEDPAQPGQEGDRVAWSASAKISWSASTRAITSPISGGIGPGHSSKST